jgi:hypothetical protein
VLEVVELSLPLDHRVVRALQPLRYARLLAPAVVNGRGRLSVIADIVGICGRRMIEALIAGENGPDALAPWPTARSRRPQRNARLVLRGRVTEHLRSLLRLHLQHIDAPDAAID